MKARADVVVVGGGLAGLAAAAFAARTGASVMLLERSGQPGGRARTRDQAGFLFNVGPHALYRGGLGKRALDELQVRVAGRVPAAGGAALRSGAAYALPGTLPALLGTRLLGWRAKVQAARLLASLRAGRVRIRPGASVDEWLRAAAVRDEVADFMRALARVTTYTDDPARLDARALAGQIQIALRAGVLYLDGGWQTIVDGLAAAAAAAGVRAFEGARAEELVMEAGHVSGVRTGDGRTLAARAVVMALSPAEAARLTGAPSLHAAAAAAVPVRAASLDLGLRRLPAPCRFALGIDRPWYFSVHSAAARLAPEGGALVHALRYLGPGRPEAASVERELEGMVDGLQPGWRDEVVVRRFVPDLVVAHDLPRADRGGLSGRFPVAVPDAAGLFVAGDWVGDQGLLADASLASARQAAALAVASAAGGAVRAAGHAA